MALCSELKLFILILGLSGACFFKLQADHLCHNNTHISHRVFSATRAILSQSYHACCSQEHCHHLPAKFSGAADSSVRQLMPQVTFSGNSGAHGGAIGLAQGARLYAGSSNFHVNTAQNGGAIYALQYATHARKRSLAASSLPALAASDLNQS